MATDYVARMPRDEFIAAAKARGWTEGQNDQGGFALVSPNGHYCHFINEAGPGLTTFMRSGQNFDVAELAEELGAVSEHQHEYDLILEIEDWGELE